MDLKVEGPLLNQTSVCVPILQALSNWFGIEKAILDYGGKIERLPTFLAKANGEVLGFLSLKQHNPYSAELYMMAVHPDRHRGGIGRALVEAAEAYARNLGVEYMQVKTLGPSRSHEPYSRTRAFYEAVGFRLLEEFKQIWDRNNPCLIMVKRV